MYAMRHLHEKFKKYVGVRPTEAQNLFYRFLKRIKTPFMNDFCLVMMTFKTIELPCQLLTQKCYLSCCFPFSFVPSNARSICRLKRRLLGKYIVKYLP